MASGSIIVPPGAAGWGGGRTSLGTVQDILAAQQQAAVQAATASQQAGLAQARLQGLAAPNVGTIPGGATGIPQEALSPRQAAMMQQLQGNAPAALEGGTPLSQPWRVGTQNFPAVESPIPMTRAGAVNAARAAGNASPLGSSGAVSGIADDVAALRGGASAPAAAAESGFARAFPTIAANAAEEGGMLGKLKGLATLGGEGKIATGLRGLGTGLALGVGGAVLGAGADAIGAPSEVGGALRGAGTGAGIGSMFGTPGAVVGGTIGGSVGALAGPAQDLGWAEHYDNEADRTVKFSRTLAAKGADDIRHKFGNATMAIQHGNNDKFAKLLGAGAPAFDVSTMQGKALALQYLNSKMAVAAQHPNHWREQFDANSAGGGGSKKKQTAVQIQMGQAMAKLGQSSIATGNAQAAALQNLAADPNMAAIAPIIQNDAVQRQAMGQQTADAYTGAAYGDLQAKNLKSQQSYINQLEQQLMSARLSASGSGGGTSLADQVKALASKTG